MAAGRLNKRVTFQEETRTSDGGGGAAVAWQDVLTCWGGYSPDRGREKLEAGRLETSAAGILKVRSSIASRALGASNRVLIDGAAHQIRSVSNPDQHKRFLEFVVELGVAT